VRKTGEVDMFAILDFTMADRDNPCDYNNAIII
jgi:hypothetical protein